MFNVVRQFMIKFDMAQSRKEVRTDPVARTELFKCERFQFIFLTRVSNTAFFVSVSNGKQADGAIGSSSYRMAS